MADSTPKQELPTDGVAQQAVVFGSSILGVSPCAGYARRLSTAGLTWQYTGVDRWYINATATTAATSSIALTGSSTRFLCVSRALAISQVATAFDPDKYATYRVVTGASTIPSWEDHRDPHHLVRFLYGRFTLAMGGANKTLTYEQAMCESMELTGNSASLLDVIVPTVPRVYTVFANTTGGGGIRVKTSAGSGVTIADTKRAIVECDGTNVVRITADA